MKIRRLTIHLSSTAARLADPSLVHQKILSDHVAGIIQALTLHPEDYAALPAHISGRVDVVTRG